MPEINYQELIRDEFKALREEESKARADRATADEAEKKKLDSRLAAIETRQGEILDSQKRAAQLAMPGLEYGKNGEKGKLSWCRLLQVCAEPRLLHQPGFETEKEAYEIQQKLAMNTGTGASGGFLVPTTMRTAIIPELEQESLARRLGVTVLSGLPPGNFTLPKSKGGISAMHINTAGEQVGTETVDEFDEIRFSPRTLIAAVPMTRDMIKHAVAGNESWVRSRIVRKIASKQDQAYFVGTGASAETRGIAANSQVMTSVSWSGVDYAGADQTATNKLIDMVLAVREKFALGLSGLGWVMAPKVLYHLAKMKDAQGRPLFANFIEGDATKTLTPPSLLRYPAFDTDFVKTGTASTERIMFGPWGESIIAEWDGLELGISDQAGNNWLQGRATVRGIMDYDVGWLYPETFIKAENVDTGAAV